MCAVLALVFWIGAASSAERHGTAGLGFETFVDRAANTGALVIHSRPQIFGLLDIDRFAVMVELSHETCATSSGGLSVRTESYGLASWGRYHFTPQADGGYFVSLGFGHDFDHVESTYDQQVSKLDGGRWRGGLGAGLGKFVWGSLRFDGEARVLLVEDKRDPDGEFILRVGYQFY